MKGRISQSMIQAVRRRMLADQGGLCLLCRRPIEDSTAVLDHDHDSGHIRGVLHRGCNAMLGHIENNRPRHLLVDDAKFKAWLENVFGYITRDYSAREIYPTHKSAEEKVVANRERARKKLVQKRLEEASPEAAAAIKAREKILRANRALKNRPKVKGSDDA